MRIGMEHETGDERGLASRATDSAPTIAGWLGVALQLALFAAVGGCEDSDDPTDSYMNPAQSGNTGGTAGTTGGSANASGTGDTVSETNGNSPTGDAGSDAGAPPGTTGATTGNTGTTGSGLTGSSATAGPTGDSGNGTTGGGVALGTCEGGSTEPCGTFLTASGLSIPLGPLGAVMEPNVGQGYENTVSPSDTYEGCKAFAEGFGQDPEATGSLLNIGDLDLSLYTVYRPANWMEGQTYPVVTWGNGTCAQPEGYGALLRYVASHGFVVVAANSRYVGTRQTPPQMSKALDFIFAANEDPASPYFGKLDTSKVAAMGHSQGSGATAAVASSDDRIDTVILFNGGTSAAKPFLAVSGDRDLNLGVGGFREAVNNAPKAAFLYYHMIPEGGLLTGHLTLMTQPERVIEPTVAWLQLLLNDDAAAREWFVGSDCKLCNRAAEFEFGQRGLEN